MPHHNLERQPLAKLTKSRKLIFAVGILLVGGALLFNQNQTNSNVNNTVINASVDHKSKKIIPARQYTVQAGDTLEKIFKKMSINSDNLQGLLEADHELLTLEEIKPGQTLLFTMDGKQLDQLEIQLTPANKISYTRKGKLGFEYNEVAIKGNWQQQRFAGKVAHSFGGSAKQAGLTLNESYFVANLLSEKIDFVRKVQANDRFEILVDRQYIDGHATGNSHILAVRIYNQAQVVAAYAYKDGYYDEEGNSLEKGFRRLPLLQHYRISSPFNLRRVHPVTGLLRPHKGTDFAVPTGTTIVSTADGIVKRVTRHPYAGLYIEIDHNNGYSTRYLHLSKAIVKVGQHVNRGEKIALSGNTGRTTGAHLHFELRANNIAVNAMTTPLPIAKLLEKHDRQDFKLQVASYQSELDRSEIAMIMPMTQLHDPLGLDQRPPSAKII